MNAREAAPKDRPAATTVASQRRSNGTAQVRRSTPVTHVIADPKRVVSGTGAERFVLLWRCFACGQLHLSHSRGDLPLTVDRKSPHGGVVRLHVMAEITPQLSTLLQSEVAS